MSTAARVVGSLHADAAQDDVVCEFTRLLVADRVVIEQFVHHELDTGDHPLLPT